jgi:hypothetical protein
MKGKKNVKPLKEEVINVRCTTQQKKQLEVAATRKGLGISTWLLYLGLESSNPEQAQ